MARGPRILASFVQSTLDAVARRDAALAARVRDRLRPETRSAIESASAIAFVPIELDVELTEALFEVAGEGRACGILRENLSSSFEAPILRSFVSAALRMLGRSPERLLRWAPKVWAQLYRDAGEMRFEGAAGGTARLELARLPDCVATSRPYMVGLAAAIEASFDLMEVAGEVHLAEHDPAAGRACIALAWKSVD